MKNKTTVVLLVAVFLAGIAVGTFAAAKKGVDSSAWDGATPEEASQRLLYAAESLIEKDESWQEIHYARVLYLSGEEGRAEAIFNRFSSGKSEGGDLVRIARVYAHGGEWEKAKGLYDRLLEKSPKDEDWLIEAGAFYNLDGDRETAEALFARGFEEAPKKLNNILSAAGSYAGVPPRRR